MYPVPVHYSFILRAKYQLLQPEGMKLTALIIIKQTALLFFLYFPLKSYVMTQYNKTSVARTSLG